MATWYQKNLGDGMMAYLPIAETEKAFERFYSKACPSGGIYKFQEMDDDMFCQITLYFSPQLADFAKNQGATPCPPPQLDYLTLVLGSEQ